MILFVDLEHESGRSGEMGTFLLANRTRITYLLEDITGDTCLLQRYHTVNPAFIARHGIRAMFLSGSGTDASEYDEASKAGLREVIREARIPIFGFCAGWQWMAESLGSPIEHVGRIPDGEPDSDPDYMPGWLTESGYLPVEVVADHRVLEGLGEAPVFRHFHGQEIKQLPEGFSNYARTTVTEHQLAIHDTLPLLGTQFHPEYPTEEHPEGRVLIENFCRWSGLIEP